MSLLEVSGLSIAFGGHNVVSDVAFSLQAGEKLALVGESGSGKTVTALSLVGLVQGAQVTGKALFVPGAALTTEGKGAPDAVDLLTLPERALQAIRGQDIAMIFQEPMTALNPLFTVGDQIAEVVQLKQGLTRQQSAAAAVDLLAATGIPEPGRRSRAYPHQLSGGQRQRAMIAMAIACKPRLLLADEPTTALDVTVRKQILALLADLQRQFGMAVLLITHDLGLVRQFADRVAVMERGCIVEQGVTGDVFANPQHPYTRRLIDSKPRRNVVATRIDPGAAGAPVAQQVTGQPANQAPAEVPALLADGLRVSYPVPKPGIKGWFSGGRFVALAGARFSLLAGQTLGIVGESGSGKSTLALATLGLLPFEGQLQIAGQAWSKAASANLAIRKKLQVVFQDPFSSLSPRLTVAEMVGEGLLVHAPAMDAQQRLQKVQTTLQTVGLTEAQFPGLLQRYAHQFSGGQRQRLAIARALIVEPQILVLDEPTSALDVTMAQQILTLLQDLQRHMGLSYLLITHDVEVVKAMAHAVLVMKNGEIVEGGPLEQVFSQPSQAYTRTLLEAST